MTEQAGYLEIVSQLKRFAAFAALAMVVLAAPVAAERYAGDNAPTRRSVDAASATANVAVGSRRIEIVWEIEAARSEQAQASNASSHSRARKPARIVIAAQ